MSTANKLNNNLTPWKPDRSGNLSGRPKGTRDLAGYVLETTDGGKELVDALVSKVRRVMPNVPVKEGSRPGREAGAAGRPAEGHRDDARPWLRRSPQQLDIAHSVSDQPLESLSDETLRLLVENARQLKEGSGVVVDVDGLVISE